jgi:hypothetical protein
MLQNEQKPESVPKIGGDAPPKEDLIEVGIYYFGIMQQKKKFNSSKTFVGLHGSNYREQPSEGWQLQGSQCHPAIVQFPCCTFHKGDRGFDHFYGYGHCRQHYHEGWGQRRGR